MVNKVRVTIAGAPYAIATTDSEKYITSLAKKLDEDITKLLDTNDNLSVTKAAVFCAMDYLDEYRKSTGSAENMRSQIQSYIADAAHAKLAEDKAKAENETLRRENAALREQLAQDKADLEQQQAELTASKTELDAQVAEATRVFEEYAASEAGQQALLNQQAAREKELQEEIRKSEEANRNNQTAVGGFIWPTACRLTFL